ncbi:MAG TPA: hypothetical protein VMW81_00870 [Nitrospinota bacterium]|nr:hypothetical protein [Nitrospinota bacterium]
MKISPFHSKRSDTAVYHNKQRCSVGKRIKRKNRVSGMGRLLLCEYCKRLGVKSK